VHILRFCVQFQFSAFTN